STLYHDYSINEELFHWQSQSRTSIESITGQRYVNHSLNGNNVLFFVREYKRDSGFAAPFTCIGLADYVSHYGSTPINIVWKMKEQMPGFILRKAMKI
ncbi:MAG: helicase, superfamily, partial [Sporomusa sp.]|nr:helicase, superfamily [Sporomusa sp.]